MRTSSVAEAGPRAVSRRRVRVVFAVVLTAVALGAMVVTAGGLGDAWSAIQRMDPNLVVAAAGFSAARLALYALQLRMLGRRTGPFRTRDAASLALLVYGFGAVMPAAPAEGLALGARELRRRGRSTTEARLVLAFSEWFAQRTFYALAALDLVVLVIAGDLSVREAWPFLLLALAVVVALVATAILARRGFDLSRVTRPLRRLRLRHPVSLASATPLASWHDLAMRIVGTPSLRLRLAIVSALAVVCDAATLGAACRAAGHAVPVELVLLATTVGTMASWVPLLPSGLGLVEAAIPTILHRFGVPLDAAIAATVAYRALGTLAPALVGGFVTAVLQLRVPAPSADR